MKSFKFFGGESPKNDIIVLPENLASWTWARSLYDVQTRFPNLWETTWRYETIHCNGIVEFLNLFPERAVVPVFSITGNGIRHDFDNQHVGWGFDIQRDPLVIECFVSSTW